MMVLELASEIKKTFVVCFLSFGVDNANPGFLTAKAPV